MSLWRLALAALLALLPALGAAAPLAATPIARLDLPWWRQRFEQKQQAIREGAFDLIYYGDSITQNFEAAGKQAGADWPAVWRRFYGARHALNLGFKGDTTASLLWRVQHGEGAIRGTAGAPRVAIVLIGANNMGRLHWPAADTVAGIEADVDAIRSALPHTRILLLGVLPSERSAWVTQTTETVNAALARVYGADAHGPVVFIDTGHVLLQDGRANRALFIDPLLTPPDPPLHPTAEGAARVAAAIEPTLAGMLEDRSR